MMKKAKTKINEEDFEKTISSLTLIGGSLISNGIHGIMRFMCWTKRTSVGTKSRQIILMTTTGT